MRNRTLLDELGQLWPNLTANNMRILCEVAKVPGISVGECAETLDLTLNAVYVSARSMSGGYRGCQGMGLITTQKCSDDRRKTLMRPTALGLSAAKILAVLMVAIEEDLKIKRDRNQLDLLTGAA